MGDLLYTELPVGVRQSADGTAYEVGVTIGAAFVPFALLKAGAFEDTLETAQAPPEPETATADTPPATDGTAEGSVAPDASTPYPPAPETA